MPGPELNIVQETFAAEENLLDPSALSTEALVGLVNAERLQGVHDDIRTESAKLAQGHSEATEIRQLLAAINNSTDAKGKLDWSTDRDKQALLANAEKYGVEIKDGKERFVYSRDERDRLVENLRMALDDINVQNDMLLQKLTRIFNERYESYQMARSILKPMHDDKIAKARAMAGR